MKPNSRKTRKESVFFCFTGGRLFNPLRRIVVKCGEIAQNGNSVLTLRGSRI